VAMYGGFLFVVPARSRSGSSRVCVLSSLEACHGDWYLKQNPKMKSAIVFLIRPQDQNFTNAPCRNMNAFLSYEPQTKGVPVNLKRELEDEVNM